MNALAPIVEAVRLKPAVLATVVDVSGSTYRRPGARMLFPEGGEPFGLVSGGCLETDLSQRAAEVLRSGDARTVVYDMRSPDDIVWGLGLGCNGLVRVLLERLSPDTLPVWLDFAARCDLARQDGVVATIFETEGLKAARVGDRLTLDAGGCRDCGIGDAWLREAIDADARGVLSARRSVVRVYRHAAGATRVLIEHLAPTVRLIVFGAGQDAVPLTRFARELGWHVTVADDRPDRVKPLRFPAAHELALVRFDRLEQDAPRIDTGTVVVVMTHHFLHDLDLLQYLLETPAAYLGFLGPAQRTRNLLTELVSRGARPTPDQLARLHGPLGLDIGSETPEEIALSALAEIRAVLAGKQGGFLRVSEVPLHARTS